MKNGYLFLDINLLESGIVHIALNRPDKLNCLNQALLQELNDVITRAAETDAVKALLLTGQGRVFCAGADIQELANLDAQSGTQFAKRGQKVFNRLERLTKPVVAAIHGAALGGGCELAMAAHIRIAATDTKFGQPEVQLGLIPGFGGSQRLSRLIGRGPALAACLTGEPFFAEQALQWGLVSQVVAAEALEKTALACLERLLQLPPIALASLIEIIHEGAEQPLKEALHLEASHFGLLCATKDKQEGVAAFLEKRAANFSGE